MACYLDCELLDQRKETKEPIQKKQEMIVDHTKEKNKRKKWENKAATFYYVRACNHGKPSQTNHDGIINNIKPIQQYKLYMAL